MKLIGEKKLETRWETFQNEIYLKTTDGGKNMFREFNILPNKDFVEVYFANDKSITIPLIGNEYLKVQSFEKEMREKGIFQKPYVRTMKSFSELLIEKDSENWVFISNSNAKKLDEYAFKKLIELGNHFSKGYYLLKSSIHYFDNYDGRVYRNLIEGFYEEVRK